MTKKRIFLHIGTHKTATTTIQAGCFENRETLLEDGWLYPGTGMFVSGHHNIAWEFLTDHHPLSWNQIEAWAKFRPKLGGMNELLAEINASPVNNVILSSENFDQFPTECVSLLKDSLTDYQVEIIVYLREQGAFLQSAWAQFVKTGYITQDFRSFIEEKLFSTDEDLRYFGAYDLFLIPWINSFGKQHVHPIAFSGGNIFHDFLNQCEVPNPGKYVVPENQNVSPGYKTLEMIRFLTKGIVSLKGRANVIRSVKHIAKESHWDTVELNLIDAALSSRIQSRFITANQFLSDQFCPGEPFFKEGFVEKPLSSFDLSSMTASEWETIAYTMATYIGNEYF